MSDSTLRIDELKGLVKKFTEDRDWVKFHSPKTLTQALVLEASELMELFLWEDNASSKNKLEVKRNDVEQEMADVFWCF